MLKYLYVPYFYVLTYPNSVTWHAERYIQKELQFLLGHLICNDYI